MSIRQTGAEFNTVNSGLSTDLVEIQRYVSASPNPYWSTYNITLANLLSGGIDFTTLNLGASGTAGTLNIFPATAAKGHLTFVATNNTGNTVTTITNAAMGQASVVSVPDPGASTANFVLDKANQTIAGNKTLTGTTQINTLEVGASGTAGTFQVFQGTASKGYLALAAVANTGNTATTISNAAMGQASTISIPDPGAASANFLLDHGTNTLAAGASIIANKVNGTEAANAVTASGMSGVITTSSLTTAGGSSYAITWTNTFISSTSTVLLSIQGGSNSATQNITLKVAPGSGSATLTIYNNTAATALNGTILIGYLVI